jgi:hypothetical protein
MNEPSYEFTVLKEAHRFDFLSIGRTAIHKAIIYFNTQVPGFYNLVLTDVEANGEMSIYTVSGNGDMKYILSTVYQTINHFISLNPEAVICSTGSTESRTRLYQIAISANLKNLEQDFDVYASLKEGGVPEVFCKGRSYQNFFICKKNKRFIKH